MVVGKDGNVARKNVVTGDATGGNWLITSGLDAGDQIIVSGLQKVKEGAPAKATPWKPEAPAAAGKPTAAAAKPE
jgi:membrane fusion protein (multidrug efflux system)